MMEQILLFNSTPPSDRFRPGEIVRQTWPWIGKYDTIFPYWQVRFAETGRQMRAQDLRHRHPKWSQEKIHRVAGEEARPYGPPDEVKFYCTAVPYGVFPGEVHWFGDKDLVTTGLHWKLPTWEELEAWCETNHGESEFVCHLNSSRRTEEDGEWVHHSYPPYREEEELARLLRTLPVPWADITRENFFSLFPEGKGAFSPAKIEALPLFASLEDAHVSS